MELVYDGKMFNMEKKKKKSKRDATQITNMKYFINTHILMY